MTIPNMEENSTKLKNFFQRLICGERKATDHFLELREIFNERFLIILNDVYENKQIKNHLVTSLTEDDFSLLDKAFYNDNRDPTKCESDYKKAFINIAKVLDAISGGLVFKFFIMKLPAFADIFSDEDYKQALIESISFSLKEETDPVFLEIKKIFESFLNTTLMPKINNKFNYDN